MSKYMDDGQKSDWCRKNKGACDKKDLMEKRRSENRTRYCALSDEHKDKCQKEDEEYKKYKKENCSGLVDRECIAKQHGLKSHSSRRYRRWEDYLSKRWERSCKIKEYKREMRYLKGKALATFK